MKDYLIVKENQDLRLKSVPTKPPTRYSSKHEYKKLLGENHARLEDFQTLLYADKQRALLVIFQGMDTAGKDGAIKHVMSGVNPQGCAVTSFKTPTSNELEHDYLWRANRALPERGQIGIFNRSYYEEALITRVHPELLKKEKVPMRNAEHDKFWRHRYEDILNYETYLHRQGYEIIKIFIHISKDEQKRRLLDRFSDSTKLWKISEGDVRERAFWKEYQFAYEECLKHTSSKSSPWYLVAGDDKKSARLSISQILVDRFERMKLAYPTLTSEQKSKLKNLKLILSQI